MLQNIVSICAVQCHIALVMAPYFRLWGLWLINHTALQCLINLDCFDVWKVETNVGRDNFEKNNFFKFLFIISADTASQSVFLIIKDE